MKKQFNAVKPNDNGQKSNGSENSDIQIWEAIFTTVRSIIIATADVARPPEQVFSAFKNHEIWKWQGSEETYLQMGWAGVQATDGEWNFDLRMISCPPNGIQNDFLEIYEPRK